MWIDTHCHLDAQEFGDEPIAECAAQQGVSWMVIPAIERANFSAVSALAHRQSHCVYAMGIHPLCVSQADEHDLIALREAVSVALDDLKFVAIGEIGLDFFIPELNQSPLREKQEYFYGEQLRIARECDLPVLLHVRRSQDTVLKFLRRITVPGGIAHAFNGSFQQAQQFIDLGFKLGFGGAMTFPRALQIRRLASELPQETIVLETDAPDMAPVWLHSQRNSPAELPRIGQVLAELRGVSVDAVKRFTAVNACDALPYLGRLISQPMS